MIDINWTKYIKTDSWRNKYLRNDFGTLSISNIFVLSTGVCETGYTGTDCNQCETGYYGDGNTCTGCGTHKTTPASGSATTADQCTITLFWLT